MAKVYISKHGTSSGVYPKTGSGADIPVLSAPVGDCIDLDTASGEAHTADLEEGLYEISVDGAAVRIVWGKNVTAVATANKCKWWRNGRDDVVFVRGGDRISVISA